MVNPHRFSIGSAEDRLALVQWGDNKPPALLLHGTGFCADVWDEIARDLASDYTVYAVDRRGHGESHKPPAGHYHFLDYAEDVCRIVETLGLRDIYGIGHSAGATDLLLSAKLLPEQLHAPVRDGADRDGPPRGTRCGIERWRTDRRRRRAAPAGRVRQL